MQKKGGKALHWIRKFNDAAVILLILGMTVVVLLQVFCRYILQSPLRWSEEAARYMLIWMVLLGSGVATRNRSHLQVDILTASLPEKPKKVLTAIVDLLTVVFLVILIIYGFKSVASNISQTSPAMRVQMGLIYIALPLGGGLMLIENLVRIFSSFRKEKE